MTVSSNTNYEQPSILVVGDVAALTAGPVTPYSEQPSGQSSTQSIANIPVAEDE